ncbi:MAG: 16S rRNA (adenine(1518)-N(6)/adenine(1519)-N(6))-dimethyltransferase RsmA [Holosporales bacterium]|jgi:16S rRNA (adenine1518-N6/adenine1519-N6)-dimethyltransferase|nr:16S rRNA (adenine(1518)-N(6)/adenine(1519)-N(6))-dimethyltransferase RsmA [Holosporales bacterium]
MLKKDKGTPSLTIKQVVTKAGVLENRKRAKSLGQHFLSDLALLKKIASCSLPFDNCDIVEIGPGPCGLTRAILELTNEACDVYCIEKDKNFEVAHNDMLINHNNLRFVYSDALLTRPQDLTQKNIIIISNLPYNISSQLLVNWLLDIKNINKMTLMFQKEVAQRICARLNTKVYGRLSVIAQLLCRTEKLFDVSAKAFFPVPKVESSVVKLTPKKLDIENIDSLEKLISLCFQQRRKTIFSILKRHYRNIENILKKCNIDKLSRPENISPEKFLELALNIDNGVLVN